MAKILLVWELGGGLGHVLPLRGLADLLAQRGHQIWVAARDPLRLAQVFAGSDHRLLAAPLFNGVCINPSQLCSLADVIWFDSGGHDPQVLTALLRSWRTLYQGLGIDLLIADGAPAAIAAADGLLPAICFDVGFHSTDPASWAPFRDWEKTDPVAVQRRADALLVHLNQARGALGLAQVGQLSDGFRATRTLLRKLAELDDRGERPEVLRVGALLSPGALPSWPAGAWRQRVLVYVRSNYALMDRLIGALARLEHTAVLFFHESPLAAKLPTHPHVQYFSEPLDLHQALPQVDLVVCHGGMLQTQSTCYGKPTLALPMHSEQFLQSRQSVRAGVALMLSPADRPDFLTPIRRLLAEPEFTATAYELAERQRSRCPDPVAAVLAEVDALLSASYPPA